MSVKMKGLLKGLRYISQIFEEDEKEADIQIGFPTDVKHVAHIGWDGPSASSPSWMTEFKESPASSATSQANGDSVKKDPGEVKKQESSAKKNAKESSGRDLPSLPKSSRRQASVESVGSVECSPPGSPAQKSTKSSRRRSKQKESSSPKAAELSSSIPNVPKKSRRKKSKDGEESSRSSRSKERGSRRGSRHGSDDGSITNLDSGD